MNPLIQWAEKIGLISAKPAPTLAKPIAPPAPPAPSANPSAAPEPAAEAIIQAPMKENPMKIADWLRGVATVLLTDVEGVFTKAKAVVAIAPLPANLKTDLTQTLTDAQSDLSGLASLAGTELGSLIADGVDDGTTLFMNIQQAIAKGEPLTVAGAAALKQAATAITAQIDTLASQAIAGIDVLAAPAVAPKPAPAPAT
jgi:hypothetical protein